MSEAADPPNSTSRKFRVIRSDATPAGALTWGTLRQKDVLLRCWRRGVIGKFPQEARVNRLAWAL